MCSNFRTRGTPKGDTEPSQIRPRDVAATRGQRKQHCSRAGLPADVVRSVAHLLGRSVPGKPSKVTPNHPGPTDLPGLSGGSPPHEQHHHRSLPEYYQSVHGDPSTVPNTSLVAYCYFGFSQSPAYRKSVQQVMQSVSSTACLIDELLRCVRHCQSYKRKSHLIQPWEAIAK